MKLEFSHRIFEKYSGVKLYENPSSVSRVVPCGRTDTAKLIFAFRNFVNAPKPLPKFLPDKRMYLNIKSSNFLCLASHDEILIVLM